MSSDHAHVRADGQHGARGALRRPPVCSKERSRGKATRGPGVVRWRGRFTDSRLVWPDPTTGLLVAAQPAADWFSAHHPPTPVPYWDFRAPAIPNTERDASAAAMLRRGCTIWPDRRAGAAAIARRLIGSSPHSHHMAPTPPGTILAHSPGARPAQSSRRGKRCTRLLFVEAASTKGFPRAAILSRQRMTIAVGLFRPLSRLRHLASLLGHRRDIAGAPSAGDDSKTQHHQPPPKVHVRTREGQGPAPDANSRSRRASLEHGEQSADRRARGPSVHS
jgi:hypothetical protein